MNKYYKFLSIAISVLFVFIIYPRDKKTTISKKANLTSSFSQRKAYVKGVLKKDSPNLFADYYSKIKTEFGKDKPSYPSNYKFTELGVAQRNSSLSKKNNLDWISRGPGNVGGRVRGIIIDPDDTSANTWFVAAVGGGVWKTTNAGSSWENLTNGMTNLSASYMAMDPSNHDVIYVGTGEGFGNLDALGAQGIWKTENRGGSWQQLSYTANETFGVVNRIIIDPNNSKILLAATSPGNNSTESVRSNIWRSTDGGDSWGSMHASDSRIQQIVYNPNNFNIQYATLNDGKVLKSVDAGKTWNDSSSGLVGSSRVELAISSVDPTRLFASVAGGKSDVYVSSDSGSSWKRCYSTENFLGGQGWYDNAIIVDPFDENIFYVAGVNIFRGKYNGGNKVDITKLTDNYGSDPALHKGTHVDNHFFAVAKLNSNSYRLVGSNDGGVCYTDDKGATFTQPNTGFVTTQFYGIDKANGKDLYIGGMQDNSCYVSPINSTDKGEWDFVFGGDGFDVVWNYNDENKVMFSSQFNNIKITHTGIDNLADAGWYAGVDTGNDSAPFFTKLSGSKQFTDLVFTFGKSGVWRTDDFGVNWNSISMPEGFRGDYSVSEVKISLNDPSVVWAGTSLHPNSSMNVSTDFGNTFHEVSSVDKVTSYLSGFATHPKEKGTAYALFSAAKKAKVYRTVDFGETWVDISGFRFLSSNNGFPDVAVFDLLVMPYDTDVIWVGTEIGIFESTDNGAHWHYANNGLPPVSVYDLLIVNDEVIVGTHGRGVWSVSLPGLAGHEPEPTLLPAKISSNILFEENKQIAEINVEYRDDYESVEIYLNDVLLETITGVTKGESIDLSSELVPEENFIKVVSKLGVATVEYTSMIFAIPFKTPSSFYVDDFNNSASITNEFYGDGYEISTQSGFDTKAINTNHPYGVGKDFIIYLKTPIIVDAEFPKIKYKDVALVEPGEPGVVYPNQQFWDYVTIEGSVDGKNWIPMVTPYDASFNAAWKSLYTNDTDPTKVNFIDHVSSTTDFFNDGDVIIIRFRLYSDANSTGWGWIIDDLEIQKGALSIDDNYLSTQFKVYPNPVIDEVLHLESTTDSKIINIEMYNLSGQVLLNKNFAKVEKAKLDISNFAKGQYLIKVETDKGAFSKKIMVK